MLSGRGLAGPAGLFHLHPKVVGHPWLSGVWGDSLLILSTLRFKLKGQGPASHRTSSNGYLGPSNALLLKLS